jgi:hypothetical protein
MHLVAIARGDTAMVEVAVVDVVNVRDVCDASVGDIYAIEITAARAIPGDVSLTITQRAPAKTSPETNANAPPAAAEPRD